MGISTTHFANTQPPSNIQPPGNTTTNATSFPILNGSKNVHYLTPTCSSCFKPQFASEGDVGEHFHV